MQFKIVRHRDQNGVYHEGNTVQCLRRAKVAADDHPDGKNVQRVVAKIDRWARELPPAVAAILTADEQSEWHEWRIKHDEARQRTVARFELDALPERLHKAAEALQLGAGEPSMEEAQAIWSGMDAMSKALSHAGFERPKKSRGRPVGKQGLDVNDDEQNWASLPNFAPPGTEAHRAYQRLLDDFAARRKMAGAEPPAKQEKKP